MYRLREMDSDDKVCEQVDVALLSQVYPREVIERCVGQSGSWKKKRRRVRQSTMLALVWFVIAMALWSRLEPMSGVGKTGDQTHGYPSSRARCPTEQFGSEWATSSLRTHRTAGTDAGAVCGHSQSRSDAICVLWSVPADGY